MITECREVALRRKPDTARLHRLFTSYKLLLLYLHIMATASLSKKAASKIFCDHCQSFVGKSTYYRHRARYYNQQGKRWERGDGNSTESLSSESEGESVSEPITETTNEQVLTPLGCQ